ncbi:hypothetical protein D3C71_1355230 [compost metagenome]
MLGLALAAAQHLDAGEQFGKGVRLRQIIIAAGAQAGHAVIHLPQRGKDQNRRLDTAAAQLADDGKPVAARQHAVDHHHVIGILAAHEQAALTVARVIGDDPDFAERLGHIGRSL